MTDGFLKVAAVTPKIKVADTVYNAGEITNLILEADHAGAKVIVLPELCITGYTCSDLFLQDTLLNEAKEALFRIAKDTEDTDALVFVGLPIEKEQKLYNAAAVLKSGEILAFIPKENIPSYGEFYEARHFTPGNHASDVLHAAHMDIPFGTDILFACENMEGLVVGCEICEDVWAAETPGTRHALAGADVIVNLSASNDLVGKDTYRKELVKATSARLLSAYVYASAGDGESTQDVVYSGHNIIAENGTVLSESVPFTTGILYADLDIQKLRMERRRMTTFVPKKKHPYLTVSFHYEKAEKTELSRTFNRTPFVPADENTKTKRCEQILSIQANGLKKRLAHTNAKTAVIGISGGLDSTLALLVTVRAFDMLGLERSAIKAVTMPCFGTTDRTYENACKLAETCGAELIEVDIKQAVLQHFADIQQDVDNHDVTYENSQARERTQVLMDIANKQGGLVIGTGDMSELALGWATYNGDHMSMYGVNAGVPKTLVRHLVQYYADTCNQKEMTSVLLDVIDTPVSPELLPPKDNGKISQKTEDLVGPYELHDFFLYYMLRCSYPPSKVYRIAVQTFKGEYDTDVILKWLKTFYRRFFAQQFKRSCIPDGPKVGSVALSPRGDLRMPSDACARIWLDELERI
ncbi:NAD(+) synthase [Lachnospiraceae bacterium MD335]|nr:NAD(+) synthase [Lachnospiraceae bacterium MD335]